MSIAAAARATERELLESLRDAIAQAIDDGVPARDLASLSRRLLEIKRELAALEVEEEGDEIDAAAATPDEPWPAA